MKKRKALCLMLSLALILGAALPGTFAVAAEESSTGTTIPVGDPNSANQTVMEASDSAGDKEMSTEAIHTSIHDATNGVMVEVSAPAGAFPNGTTVSVQPVSDGVILAAISDALTENEAECHCDPLAYDITFTYNNNEIQPAAGYEVKVSFLLGDSMPEDVASLSVYHMNEAAAYTAELVTTTEATDRIEFAANAFSIYAVVGTYSDNWNYNNYQIVMTVGDTLEVSTTANGNSYAWSKISGSTSSFVLANSNNKTASVTANAAGEMTLQCEITNRRNTTTETMKVVALPSVGNRVNDDIVFVNIDKAYTPGDTEYENTYGPYAMKIRFEDDNGNVLKYGDGSTVGKEYYVFDSATGIDVNTFAAAAPDGYTYAGAFFYWTGHFSGDKVYVTSIERDNSNTATGSHLWYSGTHSTSGAGRWTYQASGVLHVVYAPTSTVHTIVFKDHCGYELANYALKHNDGGVTFPYGYVDNIDNMKDTLIPNHHAAHDPGYTFNDRWTVSGGGAGIDGEYTTAQLKSAITGWKITSNIVITAQCSEPTVTITYVPVTGTAAHDNTGGTVDPYSETIKVASETAAGSTATANDKYRFVGWFTDEQCTKPVDSTLVVNNKFTPAKVEGKNIEETYYAKFERAVADLTIRKSGWQQIDERQSFLFTVEGQGLKLDVVIHGNGEVTIKDLPIGTYTVTESTDWSWRYTPDGNGKDIALSSAGANTVTFKNTRSWIYWLSGDSYKENQFTVRSKEEN